MANALTSASWSPDSLHHPNRYWAGRHHLQKLIDITQELNRIHGQSPFNATAIDAAVIATTTGYETTTLTKGTRWAYLKVLRDIGLVNARLKKTYELTTWAVELADTGCSFRELVVRALVRSYEEKNPVHSLLGFFSPRWPSSPEDFVETGLITTLERHSEQSLWIHNSIGETQISGLGRNQFNQIWYGLLPFLEEIKLIWTVNAPATGLPMRQMAPVWDWHKSRTSKDIVLSKLKGFVRREYPQGKMVSLPDLVYAFWRDTRVSAAIALGSLEAWSNEVTKEIRLVRAPASLAERESEMYITNEKGTFGAFMRRGTK